MNKGKFVFAQVTLLITRYDFDKCVLRYQGGYKVQDFSCWNQFLCMMFGQLTHRESARDIITCLKADMLSFIRPSFEVVKEGVLY